MRYMNLHFTLLYFTYPDTYSRLATIDIGRKLGAVPLFSGWGSWV